MRMPEIPPEANILAQKEWAFLLPAFNDDEGQTFPVSWSLKKPQGRAALAAYVAQVLTQLWMDNTASIDFTENSGNWYGVQNDFLLQWRNKWLTWGGWQ